MLVLAALMPAIDVHAADDGRPAMQLVVDGNANDISGAQASSVWFGNYPQSSNGNGGFNVDPVKWRVLAKEDSRLFLLADQILDIKQYHGRTVSVTWKDCDLRAWLNGTSGDAFLAKAFSAGEQTAVATTAVVNDDNPEYDTPGGEVTNDKVFLLSVAEVTNTAYGFSESYTIHASRKVSSTAYALSLNSYTLNWWWLRTPGQYDYRAVDIRPNAEDTQVFIIGDSVALPDGFAKNGARPAFNLDLSAVLFTSAAEGSKTCENESTADALTVVGNYTGSEWKMTVKDSAHSGFAVDAGKVLFNKETGVVTVPYGGAATGTNEYISAIITDLPITSSSAAIKYYGRIAAASSADDASVTFNTSGKMQDGDYLYIFNEQFNGDKKTDYASDLIEVKRAKATFAVAPEPVENLTYNAKPQALVTAGAASGGTMQYMYSFTDDEGFVSYSDWSEGVPTATDAGEYSVWYKAIGDNNHSDSDMPLVTVEIAKKELTITANDQTYVYNGQIQGESSMAYDDTELIKTKVTVVGLEGSDEITSIVIDGQGQKVDQYPLEAMNAFLGNATGNYAISYVAGKLIISAGEYSVTEGADGNWYKGSGEAYRITVKRNEDDENCFKYYKETLIDGESAAVTAESGSTVITISADVLEELSAGEHVITVKFDDNEVETTVTVDPEAPDAGAANPEAPQTGDTSQLPRILLMAVLLGCTFILLAGRKRSITD